MSGETRFLNADLAAKGGLRCQSIDTLDGLERIEAEWWDLLARTGCASPYLTPAFLIPWARILDEKYSFDVIAVWEGDRLAGIAPLFARELALLGVKFATRSFPLHGLSPPFDLLFEAGRADVVSEMVAHYRSRVDWNLIDLLNVPASSGTVRLLQEAAACCGLVCSVSDALMTTLVRLDGDWDTYWSSLPKNLRKTIRRGRRRLGEHGDVCLHTYPDDRFSLDELLTMAFRVISNSWKRFDDEPVDWETFIRETCERFARRNQIRLRVLMVGGSPVSYHLEIEFGDSLHVLHGAYDAAWRFGDPGQVMLAAGIEDSYRRGCSTYDFMGTKDYLSRWAQDSRQHVRIQLFKNTVGEKAKLHAYRQISGWRQRRAENAVEAMRERRLREGGAR